MVIILDPNDVRCPTCRKPIPLNYRVNYLRCLTCDTTRPDVKPATLFGFDVPEEANAPVRK